MRAAGAPSRAEKHSESSVSHASLLTGDCTAPVQRRTREARVLADGQRLNAEQSQLVRAGRQGWGEAEAMNSVGYTAEPCCYCNKPFSLQIPTL